MLKKVAWLAALCCVSVYAASANETWTMKALALQRDLDLNVPLNQATVLGTHNSENSKSYAIPFVRYVDPNQTLSIKEQLDVGMRALEFDVQWTIGKNFLKQILLCHATQQHIGCSAFDRPVEEGLQELRDWLKANPNEVVFLYFDRALDGHDARLAELLNEYVGEFIFKTSQVGDGQKSMCKFFPATLSRADILKTGKQLVVYTKNCDEETSWNEVVFAGIGNVPRTPFTLLDSLLDGFYERPDCGVSLVFSEDPDHNSMWRIFEDRTFLSNLVEKRRKLEVDDVKVLLQCGINMPTFDMLEKNDPRLHATIWSWATDFPKEGKGNCAIYKKEEGIENVPCDHVMPGFACQKSHFNEWKIAHVSGTFQQGEGICQSLYGRDWHFSMPVNAKYMSALQDKNTLLEIWVHYSLNSNEQWQT